MSLINEALKKAQRQRMDESVAVPPPASGQAPTSPRPIAERRAPMPARAQVLLAGGAVALLLMGVMLTFLLLRPDSPPSAPLNTATPTTPAAKAAEPIVSAPAPAALPEITVTLPSIQAGNAAAATPPAVVSDSAAAAVPKPGGPLVVPPVPTANPKAYEFLEALRVAGIRVSATDPKVIMNDRVFRINDIVDRATQLRLTKVESSTLTFVDPSGYEYQKSF
jgi:hypothetical protein